MVATKLSLKSLARRVLDLNHEIAELDRFILPLVEEIAPNLLQLEGVGIANAGELMVAAGENPDRMRSEASFAMICGACPIPASSGKTQRHRLNRGGNRQANSALHMIVVCRMRTDPRTRDYVARRTQEGLSKREVMRCLKRYVAPRDLPRPYRHIAYLTNMRASKAASTRPMPWQPVPKGERAGVKPRLRVAGQLRSPVSKGGGVKTWAMSGPLGSVALFHSPIGGAETLDLSEWDSSEKSTTLNCPPKRGKPKCPPT